MNKLKRAFESLAVIIIVILSIPAAAEGGSIIPQALSDAALAASITAPNSGTTGTLVTLDSVATGGQTPYTYSWILTIPTGSAAALSSTTDASPTFTPDVAGDYKLDLTVTDSLGATAIAQQVTVAVTAPPLAVSITAPSTGTTGTLVNLGSV